MTMAEIETIKESGIEFKNDKKGRETAWYFSYKAMRKVRLPLAEAKVLVATRTVEESTILL